MAAPNCAKCGSTTITYQSQTYSVAGILVYCGSCGAVISWAPRPIQV
jgi:ribosomal protein S27E